MTDFAVPAPDLSRQGKRGAKPAAHPPGLGRHLRLFCLELLRPTTL